MSRTRFLIIVLVLVGLMQIYPERVGLIEFTAVSMGGVYVALWGTLKFVAYRRQRLAQRRQVALDEAEFREYEAELNVIRARFGDFDHTPVSSELRAALDTLHAKHQAMLARKFAAPAQSR